MSAKFIIDMNLSPDWSKTLNDAGIEATHWSKIGQNNAPDDEIREYAAVHCFVVLTNDLGFGAALASFEGAKAQRRSTSYG